MNNGNLNNKICLICRRKLEQPFDKHHIIPKSKGGKKTILIHRICHSKIHSVLTENQLKNNYNTVEKIVSVPEINEFIKWVSNKPPGFYKRTKRKRN
ncbi:MAG: HNH endonuclease [Candidatus Dadabacteria bacterium]|nr:HNH endonuclease [Candidatus Dadabacteria bacterium]NIQ13575.1 HNH endonuclease [Candidatus Dadabacteria bacterium]